MGTHDMTSNAAARCWKCGSYHAGFECQPLGGASDGLRTFTYPPPPVLSHDEQVLAELRAIRALLERLVAK